MLKSKRCCEQMYCALHNAMPMNFKSLLRNYVLQFVDEDEVWTQQREWAHDCAVADNSNSRTKLTVSARIWLLVLVTALSLWPTSRILDVLHSPLDNIWLWPWIILNIAHLYTHKDLSKAEYWCHNQMHCNRHGLVSGHASYCDRDDNLEVHFTRKSKQI